MSRRHTVESCLTTTDWSKFSVRTSVFDPLYPDLARGEVLSSHRFLLAQSSRPTTTRRAISWSALDELVRRASNEWPLHAACTWMAVVEGHQHTRTSARASGIASGHQRVAMFIECGAESVSRLFDLSKQERICQIELWFGSIAE